MNMYRERGDGDSKDGGGDGTERWELKEIGRVLAVAVAR
jgi:hypothetical protein